RTFPRLSARSRRPAWARNSPCTGDRRRSEAAGRPAFPENRRCPEPERGGYTHPEWMGVAPTLRLGTPSSILEPERVEAGGQQDQLFAAGHGLAPVGVPGAQVGLVGRQGHGEVSPFAEAPDRE